MCIIKKCWFPVSLPSLLFSCISSFTTHPSNKNSEQRLTDKKTNQKHTLELDSVCKNFHFSKGGYFLICRVVSEQRSVQNAIKRLYSQSLYIQREHSDENSVSHLKLAFLWNWLVVQSATYFLQQWLKNNGKSCCACSSHSALYCSASLSGVP